MPELPEVETVRRGLTDRLAGFCIANVEVLRERTISSPGGSKDFIENLIGKDIGTWQRRGKYLIASLHKKTLGPHSLSDQLDQSGFWGVHLRMTGYFEWHEQKSSPCPHTRVRFWNKKGTELRFVDTRSFGQMWWVPPGLPASKIITGLTRLGPEPFSKDFNISHLKHHFKGRKRAIKSALMDQSIVAGIGNIYADETLFLANILPQKPAGNLNQSELEDLYESLIEVLKISIGKGGTTFSDFRNLEGINGNYGQQALVYRRSGEPCRKCGNLIQRVKISGRSTHWCSKCQK